LAIGFECNLVLARSEQGSNEELHDRGPCTVIYSGRLIEVIMLLRQRHGLVSGNDVYALKKTYAWTIFTSCCLVLEAVVCFQLDRIGSTSFDQAGVLERVGGYQRHWCSLD